MDPTADTLSTNVDTAIVLTKEEIAYIECKSLILCLRDTLSCIRSRIFTMCDVPIDTCYDSEEDIISYMECIKDYIPVGQDIFNHIERHRDGFMMNTRFGLLNLYNTPFYYENTHNNSTNIPMYFLFSSGVEIFRTISPNFYRVSNGKLHIDHTGSISQINRGVININDIACFDINSIVNYYRVKIIGVRSDTIERYIRYMVLRYVHHILDAFDVEEKLKYLLYSGYELGIVELGTNLYISSDIYDITITALTSKLLSHLDTIL